MEFVFDDSLEKRGLRIHSFFMQSQLRLNGKVFRMVIQQVIQRPYLLF